LKSLIIASTSTLHSGGYLDYLTDELHEHFKNSKNILFIPYARPGGISHEQYTKIASIYFQNINKTVVGIHSFNSITEAFRFSDGIFVGGGNTFVLVNQLYKIGVMNHLKTAILNGYPYLGTSAGSNICGLTIQTTNDMPIIYPPSFKTLGILPFNINPHYLDPNPNSTHMGETRETRIKEFHEFNTQPVVGLREGSWISVKDTETTLKGSLNARIFELGKDPYELEPNSDLRFLK
jgi:dipeptidase E